MSDASTNEKLAEVLDTHGAAAYGVFWLIVEAVAFKMNESDKCEVRYSNKKWAQIAHVDSRTLAKYLQTFCKLSLIMQQNYDKYVSIKIPKLLKLRDNYTKNLQVTSQPTCKQEVEVDVEGETEQQTVMKVFGHLITQVCGTCNIQPKHVQQVATFRNLHDDETIKRAMQKTIDQGGKSLHYTDKILASEEKKVVPIQTEAEEEREARRRTLRAHGVNV